MKTFINLTSLPLISIHQNFGKWSKLFFSQKILCLQKSACHTHNSLHTKWLSRGSEIDETSSLLPTLTYFIAGGILMDSNSSCRIFVKNKTSHKLCALINRYHSTDIIYLYLRQTCDLLQIYMQFITITITLKFFYYYYYYNNFVTISKEITSSIAINHFSYTFIITNIKSYQF